MAYSHRCELEKVATSKQIWRGTREKNKTDFETQRKTLIEKNEKDKKEVHKQKDPAKKALAEQRLIAVQDMEQNCYPKAMDPSLGIKLNYKQSCTAAQRNIIEESFRNSTKMVNNAVYLNRVERLNAAYSTFMEEYDTGVIGRLKTNKRWEYSVDIIKKMSSILSTNDTPYTVGCVAKSHPACDPNGFLLVESRYHRASMVRGSQEIIICPAFFQGGDSATGDKIPTLECKGRYLGVEGVLPDQIDPLAGMRGMKLSSALTRIFAYIVF